jgi:NAD(P)-dependent dehydrogenase (short-subunit alcohol dehydrogenase family)
MSTVNRFDLSEKVAIVTGASRGIGKAIAIELGLHGAKVVLSSRKQESLDELTVELSSQGIEARGIAAHMGNVEHIEGLYNHAVQEFGGVDIVVNNAATNPVFGPLLQSDGGVFDKIMSVNVRGPFELCKLVQPSMMERGGGSIINISSVGGISPERMLGLYSVSKSALISLTKVMAKEWGAAGIRANAICPGLIKTKFSQALWANEDILKTIVDHQPLPRIGQVEEVASLALYLASDASSFCTGSIYTADGGLMA